MRKRPFLIFVAVIGVLIAALVTFIQSPQFAVALKRVASKYFPADLGVEADFSELSIRMYPPGVSIQNPRITTRARNIINLPGGAKIKAERLDLSFLPFQMFSGNIRVHRVTIVKGDVELYFDREYLARKSKRREFHWNDLLQVQVESILLQDSRLNLRFDDPEARSTSLPIRSLSADGPGRGARAMREPSR
jgi:hypothetical protein